MDFCDTPLRGILKCSILYVCYIIMNAQRSGLFTLRYGVSRWSLPAQFSYLDEEDSILFWQLEIEAKLRKLIHVKIFIRGTENV